jgi:hypothetical protein
MGSWFTSEEQVVVEVQTEKAIELSATFQGQHTVGILFGKYSRPVGFHFDHHMAIRLTYIVLIPASGNVPPKPDFRSCLVELYSSTGSGFTKNILSIKREYVPREDYVLEDVFFARFSWEDLIRLAEETLKEQGPYNTLTANCRHFSNAYFDKLKPHGLKVGNKDLVNQYLEEYHSTYEEDIVYGTYLDFTEVVKKYPLPRK